MKVRCKAIAKSGRQCQNLTDASSGLCIWHDDDRVEERRQLQRLGGSGRSNAARARKSMPAVATVDELERTLAKLMNDVIAGRKTPGIGNAAANLARTMVSIRETATLERELAEVRNQLAEREGVLL